MSLKLTPRTAAGDQTTESAEFVAQISLQQGSELTLRKLRAFWAVAHAASLTRAAKLLGITQPSLSQQITGLEKSIGQQLFERRSNRMILTDAGNYLMRKSEHVLRGMQELEDGLAAYSEGQRLPLRLAGVDSLLRTILPEALARMEAGLARMECDLLEGTPADILEMLYSRRADIGLLAANSIAPASTGFRQIPILQDPVVLVVPETLNLARVCDPARDLPPGQQAVLNASIQIAFGTQHSRRIEDWYLEHLPQSRLAAKVRSFETALSMVRAGLGVCLAPALSLVTQGAAPGGVRLYHSGLEPRRIVALIQPTYQRSGRYDAMLTALQAAGAGWRAPDIAPRPPLLACTDPLAPSGLGDATP